MKSVALTLALLLGTMTCVFANTDAPKEENVSLEEADATEAAAPKAN
ncbi:MAG: hypothetical protein KA112_01405 [Alphaproteobacteria bacterium]|nr:hypothetical protein [Alphaproteobacteria bacterium]MBP7729258.1 hypothetical protein [Alphaproteobacteria bacterium]